MLSKLTFPRGPAHSDTFNVATGEKRLDDEHITAELSGGEGRKKVHIYLKLENNISEKFVVIGEGVTRRVSSGWVFDASLSTGIFVTRLEH